MNILVFEYITGGGFNQQILPASLLREGQLMLNSLLDNLRELTEITTVVMLDQRAESLINSQYINTAIINAKHNTWQEFNRLVHKTDAVWLIAPEFDKILQNLCQIVSDANKLLLTSPADAVAITANKWLTYLRLKQYAITTVATALLTPLLIKEELDELAKEWLIKPIDGVGCRETYIIHDWHYLQHLRLKENDYIIQPHIQGKKTSLSCLFKQGQAYLICVNEQHFHIINNSYHLKAIQVNTSNNTADYSALLADIARAFPTLWGYVGIDLIETDQKTFVLEINPRLTSSFIAITQATGINIAEAVLNLIHNPASLIAKRNQTLSVVLT